MVKKRVVLGVLVTIASLESSIAHTGLFKSGVFLGVHAGITNGSGTFNSTFETNQAGLGAASASEKARKTSALLGVVAGYRYVFPEEYTFATLLSIDAFVNDALKKTLNHSINGINFPFINTLSRQFSITPSINVGKIWCGCWHASFGLGVSISRFQYKINAPFPSSSNPINSARSSKTKMAIVPSISIEYALSQNASIIGNFSYEIYQKISKKFGDRLTQPSLPGSSYSSSISPRYISVRVGGIYRL